MVEILVGLIPLLYILVVFGALIVIIFPILNIGLGTRKESSVVFALSFAGLIILGIIIAPEYEGKESKEKQTLLQSDERIIAKWEIKYKTEGKSDSSHKHTLTYRDQKMMLEDRFPDGSLLLWKLIERPAQNLGERRFDLQEHVHSEFFTFSETGIVKFFSWQGEQFGTALATFLNPDSMNIGNNVQTRACVPKQLSPSAAEVVLLYNQLHSFKDDPEFARVGFSRTGPYYIWLEKINYHQDNSALELFDELGFFPGDVMMLGMDYMSVATLGGYNESTLRGIEHFERNIKAGLSLARCTDSKESKLGNPTIQKNVISESKTKAAEVIPKSAQMPQSESPESGYANTQLEKLNKTLRRIESISDRIIEASGGGWEGELFLYLNVPHNTTKGHARELGENALKIFEKYAVETQLGNYKITVNIVDNDSMLSASSSYDIEKATIITGTKRKREDNISWD